MASPFVPVYTADQAVRRLQDRVQRATTSPTQQNKLYTESFTAAPGGTYRVRSTTSAVLEVTLPPATPDTWGRDKAIMIMVDNTVGNIRVTCPSGQVSGGAALTTASTRVLHFLSNGAGDWPRVV
jgi:hypothetical protein